jgi:hypothetical protein
MMDPGKEAALWGKNGDPFVWLQHVCEEEESA